MDKFCMVYVTASDRDEAVEIARELVMKKLAACVNIYDEVLSVYNWEREIKEDPETVMFIKTKMSLVPELREAVNELHSYSCPCVITIPIFDINEEYENWLKESL